MQLAAVNRMVDHLVSRKTVLTKLFQDYDKDQSGAMGMSDSTQRAVMLDDSAAAVQGPSIRRSSRRL